MFPLLQVLIDVAFGLTVAEAWIRWRDKATPPRHGNEPAQPKHTITEWMRRQPVDLDAQDQAHRGKKTS